MLKCVNWFETKIFASWIKSTLLRIYFRNLSVQRSVLQYKSQCWGKGQCKIWDKKIMTWNFPYRPWYQPSAHISALSRNIHKQLHKYYWFQSFVKVSFYPIRAKAFLMHCAKEVINSDLHCSNIVLHLLNLDKKN
jgi:hypothetical protein